MLMVAEVTLTTIDVTEQSLLGILDIENSAYETPWSKNQFLDCLKGDYLVQELCLGDADDQRPIGYWVLQPVVDELHILNICIEPTQQGKGFGKAALAMLKIFAEKNRFNRILLEVRQSNRAARKLYVSAGFERIGLRRNYYPKADGGREDAWVMDFLIE